ncbi:glycosyltransferase family 2 protein [Chryseobacterium gambrini]|uniref:glycosyltransferase family 2 protein n=1 Tax=Chryseobacterium gambrini TaxID=373672 RepID=UPI0022F3C207|nr:glycosyltransferase family 2 protein [Chryseobacterium gambrini]WBX95623.1 glycosyltransferase family 2 protein [Chryseobacterium gambrini]
MDLSVIIPYYNSGNFIIDALESIEQYNGEYSVEIIIINDGSNDEYSLKVLSELQETGKYIILHQENKGAAAARNKGIYKSNGEFILFLDSDNKIKPEYIQQGVDELKQNIEAGVYYSDREIFGETDRNIPQTEAFDIEKMIVRNYIDMCSIVRKKTLLEVEGFTVHEELSSCEDWDLWLKIYKKQWQFIFNPKKLFYYRVRSGSVSDVEDINFKRSRNFITMSNSQILRDCYLKKYFKVISLEKQKQLQVKKPFKTFLKTLVYKYIKKQ